MTKRIILALLVLSSLSSVFALESLSLDLAKEIALENHLDYLSVQASRDKAESTKKSAFYSYLPSANLSGNHTRYEPESMMTGKYSNQIGISVTQPLLANGSIYYNNKIQQANSLSSEISVKQKRIEVLTQVEILYYNVLETQKNFQIAQSNVERAEQAYKNGKIKFQQNVISKDQLLRLQVDATNKAITQLNSKSAYSDAYRALKVYLNTSGNFTLQEVDFVEDGRASDKLNISGKFSLHEDGTLIKGNQAYDRLLKGLVDLSSQQNPQIALAKSGINLATYSLNQQKSSFLPSLNLSLNHNWSASEASSDFEDQTTLMLNASLSLFPLVNKYHNVTAQKMNLKAVNYNYQSLLSGIESNIETSLNSYLISIERIELAKQTLTLNEEIFKQKKTMYDSNLISVDDYLDAQVEMDQARVQYNSALYGYLKSQSSLRSTIGLENNSEFENIITLVLKEK